jgi:hypothetical protein
MPQMTLESQRADPELLRALAVQYVDYHGNIANFVAPYSLEFWLLRRLGIEPRSRPGRLAGWIVQSLVLLLPALILAAITGQWADAPLLTWAIVAVAWGAGATAAIPLFRFTSGNLLSWLGLIVDAGDLRRLDEWQRRWYSHRVIAPVSGAAALGMVLLLLVLIHGSGVQVPAGSLYIGVCLFFWVMQDACPVFMMVFEVHNLSTCRHEMYSLSPADSVAVRQSLRGYNELGAVNILFITLITFLLLALLPGGSRLVAPLVISLVFVELVYTALGTLAPRFVIGNIIRSRKEEEMGRLQRWLDDLLPRIRELTEGEYQEMGRLRETQDAIRNSPENLLPLATIFRTVGALLLSVLTILLTAFAREWMAGLVKRFVP